jgi:hypothetical protein
VEVRVLHRVAAFCPANTANPGGWRTDGTREIPDIVVAMFAALPKLTSDRRGADSAALTGELAKT